AQLRLLPAPAGPLAGRPPGGGVGRGAGGPRILRARMADEPQIAVALKYDRDSDSAPRVIAKGLNLRAEQIRELAKQASVPVMRDSSLANTLVRLEVGEEIPEELYDAVAEVLNFVYALQEEQAGRP